MTTQTAPAPSRERAAPTSTSHPHRRRAAAVAGIVLIATGFAIAAPTEATITSPEADVVAFYTEAGLAKTLAGGLIETLGLVLFLPFAAMLTDRVAGPGRPAMCWPPPPAWPRPSTSPSAWHPGMSAGAAALWLAHHGTTDPGRPHRTQRPPVAELLHRPRPVRDVPRLRGRRRRAPRRLPRWAGLVGRRHRCRPGREHPVRRGRRHRPGRVRRPALGARGRRSPCCAPGLGEPAASAA